MFIQYIQYTIIHAYIRLSYTYALHTVHGTAEQNNNKKLINDYKIKTLNTKRQEYKVEHNLYLRLCNSNQSYDVVGCSQCVTCPSMLLSLNLNAFIDQISTSHISCASPNIY